MTIYADVKTQFYTRIHREFAQLGLLGEIKQPEDRATLGGPINIFASRGKYRLKLSGL